MAKAVQLGIAAAPAAGVVVEQKDGAVPWRKKWIQRE